MPQVSSNMTFAPQDCDVGLRLEAHAAAAQALVVGAHVSREQDSSRNALIVDRLLELLRRRVVIGLQQQLDVVVPLGRDDREPAVMRRC